MNDEHKQSTENNEQAASSEASSSYSSGIAASSHPAAASSSASTIEDSEAASSSPETSPRRRRYRLRTVEPMGRNKSSEYRADQYRQFNDLTGEIFSEDKKDHFYNALAIVNHFIYSDDQSLPEQQKRQLMEYFKQDMMRANPFNLNSRFFNHPNNMIIAALSKFSSQFKGSDLKQKIIEQFDEKLKQLQELNIQIKDKNLKRAIIILSKEYNAVLNQLERMENPSLKDYIEAFPLPTIVYNYDRGYFYKIDDKMAQQITFTERPFGTQHSIGEQGGSHSVAKIDTKKGPVYTKLAGENEETYINTSSERQMTSLSQQISGFRSPFAPVGTMAIYAPRILERTSPSEPVSQAFMTTLLTSQYAVDEDKIDKNKYYEFEDSYQEFLGQYSQGVNNGVQLTDFFQMHAATWLLANQYPSFELVLKKARDNIDPSAIKAMEAALQLNITKAVDPSEIHNMLFEGMQDTSLMLKKAGSDEQKMNFEQFSSITKNIVEGGFSERELALGLEWYKAHGQPQLYGTVDNFFLIAYMGKFIDFADKLFHEQKKTSEKAVFFENLAETFMQRINKESLTDLLFTDSVSPPQDGKADNYVIEPVIVAKEDGDEIEFELRGIDNDLRSINEVGYNPSIVSI